MKFVIVFVSTIFAANAAPQLIYSAWPHVYAAPAVTQYHAQDALGQYSYGYSGGPSAKSEIKTLDGVTRGSYSYIDAESKLQTVNYVADSLGFRVAATNLPMAPVDNNAAPVDNNEAPKQVEDTEAVKQARAEHLAAVAQAKSESAEMPEGPEPVEDTEEVKQAREEHLQAVEDAKVRNSSPVVAISAPQIVAPSAAIHLASPAVFHLAHAPYAVVQSDPSKSFAYSIVAPGHPQLIAV